MLRIATDDGFMKPKCQGKLTNTQPKTAQKAAGLLNLCTVALHGITGVNGRLQMVNLITKL